MLDFFRLMPRIMLGVIGAGFVAALLPQDVVARWLGADSGATGLAIAMPGGAFTPGGPVIGFSIGAAALKGGAGTPQVIAYITAWALFAVQRMFIWELGVMPPRLVWLRIAASLPTRSWRRSARCCSGSREGRWHDRPTLEHIVLLRSGLLMGTGSSMADRARRYQSRG